MIPGELRYVTDGHTADWLVVAAREPDSRGASGVSLFILPANSEGVVRAWLPTIDQTRKQAALRFDRVHVPESARLGGEGGAWPLMENILDLARIALAAEQVGVAQQALDLTVGSCSGTHLLFVAGNSSIGSGGRRGPEGGPRFARRLQRSVP